MISLLEIAKNIKEADVDDDQIIKYKKKDGEQGEMKAGSAKTMEKDHPAKIAYDKMVGDDDSGKKDDAGKLGGGDFDRDGGDEPDKAIKEDTLNENPAAIAAAQRMVVQAKAGKKVSVNTARQSSYAKKDPAVHKKAKSMWQKIKDRFSKKESMKESKENPNPRVLKENYDRIFRSRK